MEIGCNRMDATGNDSRTLGTGMIIHRSQYKQMLLETGTEIQIERNAIHPHDIHFRSVIKQISSLSNEDIQIHKGACGYSDFV